MSFLKEMNGGDEQKQVISFMRMKAVYRKPQFRRCSQAETKSRDRRSDWNKEFHIVLLSNSVVVVDVVVFVF